jgi:hypothetical protein
LIQELAALETGCSVVAIADHLSSDLLEQCRAAGAVATFGRLDLLPLSDFLVTFSSRAAA